MLSQLTFQTEVGQIAVDVFSSMLQTEIWSIPVDEHISLPFELEAEVAISGAWNGSLTFRCTAEQARRWAVDFLPIEPDDEDVLDALGEIANMVGGNVKAILPPRNQLAVPVVRIGSGVITRLLPRASTFVVLDSPQGVFSIALTEIDGSYCNSQSSQ